MANNSEPYEYSLQPLGAGGGWEVRFKAVPDLAASGATPREAIVNAKGLLAEWIEKNGPPQTLGRTDHPDEMPELSASGRILLRLPRSLHADLKKKARTEGVSMNALAVALLARGLAD